MGATGARIVLVVWVSLAGLLLPAGVTGVAAAGGSGHSKETEKAGEQASKGILPCGRRVVLAAVYRKEGRVHFEGVANPYYAGKTAWIFDRYGEPVASAKVGRDGIFWASARSKDRGYTWLTKFIAQVDGHKSRWRRIGQAVGLRERDPVTLGSKQRGRSQVRHRTRVTVKVTGETTARVVVGLQTGCSRFDVKELAVIHTNPDGVAALNLPRPAPGDPYAIYRVSTDDQWKISPPIVVKSAP